MTQNECDLILNLLKTDRAATRAALDELDIESRRPRKAYEDRHPANSFFESREEWDARGEHCAKMQAKWRTRTMAKLHLTDSAIRKMTNTCSSGLRGNQ